MEVEDIVKDVQATFGDKHEIQIYIEDILRWINDAQLEVVRKTNCITDTDTPTIVVGTSEYDLPDDFLKFYRVRFDGVILEFSSEAEIAALYGNISNVPNSTPIRVYRKPGKVCLFPAPDAVKTFSNEYVKRPTLVDDVGDTLEIPEEMRQDIVEYCLSRAYELDDNLPSAQSKEQQFNRAIDASQSEFNNPRVDSYPSVRSTGHDLL